jgi:hypothetical protein
MIPSLLQIPSAVSDSKLHSVLPNNGKGDFTFDRSTGATRINRDGLIEEVGYFSSELVQNGNFSELGSELITNGDFSNGLTNWTLLGTHNSDNYAIVENDKLILRNDGTGSGVYQTVLTTGKTYKITLDVSEIVGNGFKIDGLGVIVVNTVGTKTFYAKATESNFYLYRNSVSPQAINGATIDNVSVKQVDPNDRWVVGAGWNITDKANYEDSTTFRIYQDLTLISGKKYKLTFDIENTTANQAYIWIGNSGGVVNYTGTNYVFYPTGSYSVIFDMPSDQTSLAFYASLTGGAFSIDNISLVEVQGDRPRLSYDITNGVVEDKPHLLLEPSATNLVTYSQDISNSYWSNSNSTSISNTVIAPDGTLTADELVDNTSNGYHWIYKAGVQSNARISFFAKANQLSQVWVNGGGGSNFAGFDLLNGTITKQGGTANPKIEEYKNGWYRCSLTSDNSGVLIATMVNNDETYIGSGKSIYLWGIQAEALSYATSYIPTAGTTITRAAETCNNSKPSVNSTEGVLYAEIEALADDGTFRFISLNNGTFDNSVTIRLDSSTNRITAICRVGGANQATINYDYSSIDFYKVAFKYKANDFVLYANGVQIGSDTSGSVFSANTLNDLSFKRGDNVHNFYGKLKGLAVYNEALSESQLMQLTGVTASSIYNNFVTRTASFTVEALNEVKKVIDNL